MNVLARLFADTKPLVHVLVCVFAVSSWVDINGMWVELPIFVTHLPEQWTLPSYIIILSQIANIGPIIFLALSYYLGARSQTYSTSATSTTTASTTTSSKKATLDKVTCYVIMVVGVTATLLLAFLWQRTAPLAGEERSVSLLALSFFLSLMDCTSSVAFVAFLSGLKAAYLPSFFIGEGLSGLLPGLMALGQGAGDIVCKNGSSVEEKNISGVLVNVTSYYEYPVYLPPRFSVQTFFLLLSAMIFASILSFGLINNLRYCRDQFVYTDPASAHDLQRSVPEKSRRGESSTRQGIPNPACTAHEEQQDVRQRRSDDPDVSSDKYVQKSERSDKGDRFSPIQQDSSSSLNGSYGSTDTLPRGGPSGQVLEERVLVGGTEGEGGDTSTAKVVALLLQVVVINFLITSFLLTVQTYSVLPYGISFYNLVVTLTNIANPLASFVSLFLSLSSLTAVTSLTLVGVACGAYIIVLAAMSPDPVLVGTEAGGPVAVAVWVGASFFLTYAKVSAAGVMRHMGRRALIWYGCATQLGALIGAVTGFVLVNDMKLFHDASWC